MPSASNPRTALVFFDRTHASAPDVAKALASEGYNVQLISPNADRIFNLRIKGLSAHIPRDFFSPEDIFELDRECFSLDESLFEHNGSDLSVFGGKSLMGLGQYALVPPLIRAWRDLASAKRAIKKLEPSRVIIMGRDGFTDAARLACDAARIRYEERSSGWLMASLSTLKELFRLRSTGWQQTTFKYIILESILEIWMIAGGLLARLRRGTMDKGDRAKSGPRLVFVGDTYSGLDLHRHLRDNPGWDLHTCGMDLRLRQRLFPDVRPIEVFFRFSMLWEMFKAHLHMRRAWALLRRDAGYRARFRAEGLDAWPLLEGTIGLFAKYYIPRLHLDYLIGREAFKARPRQTVLVVPSDVMPYTKALVLAARAEGARSLVMQHGFLGMINGHAQLYADMLAGWGEGTRQWYAALGNDPSRIVVTGNPRYDVYANAPLPSDDEKAHTRMSLGISGEGPVITVFTSWFNDFSLYHCPIDDLLLIERTLCALGELGLSQSCCVILKTHPALPGVPFRAEIRRWQSIVPRITAMRGNLPEAISISSLCVGMHSSTMIEAMLMGVPFISYESLRYKAAPYADDLERFGAAPRADSYESLRGAIRTILLDEAARKGLLDRHAAYLDHFAYQRDGRATERVFRLVESLAESQGHRMS